jgi:UPF0042 nucleotide-binding protein
MMDETPALLVVTGVSGAGKSTAVNALEDLGYFCVDNLPPPVAASTIESLRQAGVRKIALGIDVRVREFLDDATRVLDLLATAGGAAPEIVFLDASDEALLRRFSSTRRPHPLSTESKPGAPAVIDGIRRERDLLAALRARASFVLDTTRLSVHDLRRAIVGRFGPAGGKAPRLRIRVVSFGFKFGSPVDADMLFDARFLPNPHFVEELRPLPGTDPSIQRYVLESLDASAFLGHVTELLAFCIPRFESEGRSYLTVGIGCTGGRHRSVVLAERLAAGLRDKLGLSIDVVHRDLHRVNLAGPEGDPDHGPRSVQGGHES